jgi:ABC-type antimicrobial peptide transport system permease subunit
VTPLHIVSRSLRHYWRTNLFIMFGVMIATAVMTGSLLVGDSMTASLRENFLSRLGHVEHILVTPHFFPDSLGNRLASSPPLANKANIATLLLTRGVARPAEDDSQAARVTVFGIDDQFWTLFPHAKPQQLTGDSLAISQSLADDLKLKIGDEIVLNVDRSGTVSDDILFANRGPEDTLRSLRGEIKAIIPANQGGDFGFDAGSAGGTSPRNIFLARKRLGTTLEHLDSANAILIASKHQNPIPTAYLQTAVAATANLADYGLAIVRSETGNNLMLESSSLLLTDDQITAATGAANELKAEAAPTSVYLATRIAKTSGEPKEIAYTIVSTLTRQMATQTLPADAAILNRWAATDLDANEGDSLQLTYLVPKPDGSYKDATTPLTLKAIVEMETPGMDRQLTPSLNGLTDAKRIDDWDLPFPVDRKRLTDRDEEYWEKYGPTPKIFVTDNVLKEIWKNSARNGASGWITGVRVSLPQGTEPAAFEKSFSEQLLKRLSPEQNQIAFRAVREQATASAAGSTDFGQLFLAMSGFLIISAGAMAGMLMRLMVEQRAREIGLLISTGWQYKRVQRLLLLEGAAITALGVLLGLPAGIFYNWAILNALSKWWMGPWGHPILRPQVSLQSLVIGAISGLILGLICVYWGVCVLRKKMPLDLLSGRQALAVGEASGKWAIVIPMLAVILAVGLFTAAAMQRIPMEVAFFSGGAALLVAALTGLSAGFRTMMRRARTMVSTSSLAMRNAGANRRRSVLSAGLLASASFILVAVAANRRDYSQLDTTDPKSGAGGFVVRATTASPLHFDAGTPSGRTRLGISPQEEKVLSAANIIALAESPGDDVSCLNLARPAQPRLLGVTPQLADRNAFNVNRIGGQTDGNPWLSLFAEDSEGAIPAFGDADSVQWILHSKLGGIITFQGPSGTPVKLRIVGVIPGSIFAGELLVSDENLRRIFPDLNGSSYLIAAPTDKAKVGERELIDALRSGLADYGVEVRTTREILNRYISVQNVYLSIFLSLGGLGLLLGTAGMIAVIARSVLERRRELALMAAAGFRRSSLVRLVALEHAGLLIVGVVAGTACALLAATPILRSGRADVQWTALVVTLGAVALVGLCACIMTARWSIGTHPMRALREE